MKKKEQLTGVATKPGRSASGAALSNAERQRRYRQNKLKSNQVEIRRFVTAAASAAMASLEKNGVTLDKIILDAVESKLSEE